MKRWAIYIDIQGFCALWDKGDKAILSLCELMRAISRIGKICYPKTPDRLFAHQFGDGFLIISNFEEKSLERCVMIAIALLRHVATTGCFAKASIVEGDMQGINGCYPEEVMSDSDNQMSFPLGEGLMTIVPVMGTALIRGVKLDKKSPKGPLLIIENEKYTLFPQGVIINKIDNDISSINWVACQSDLLSNIQRQAKLKSPSESEMENALLKYCEEHKKTFQKIGLKI